MRFMMIVKASKESEAGEMPSEKVLADMAKYNEELVKAGRDARPVGPQAELEGRPHQVLGQQAHGHRRPFAETKELVAGFWIIQVKSKEEAIEWAKRVPFDDGEVELRPFFELEDFAPGPAIEHHRRVGEELDKQKS